MAAGSPTGNDLKVADPVYGGVMIVHVLAAVIGFGALGSTGAYASYVQRCPNPLSSPALIRYFAKGKNIASRSVLVVPILGGTLLWLGNGADVSKAFPWIGLGIWCLAVGVTSALIWPGENKLQECFGASARTDDISNLESTKSALVAIARKVELASAATSVLFVIAMVVMIAQPGL